MPTENPSIAEPASAQASQIRPDIVAHEPVDASRRWSPETQKRIASLSASFLIHMVGILLLALVFSIRADCPNQPSYLTVSITQSATLNDKDFVRLESRAPAASAPESFAGVPIDIEISSESSIAWQEAQARRDQPRGTIASLVPALDWLAPSGAVTGGGIEGRSAGMKSGLLRDRGGNQHSEEAVLQGLRWLALHQRSDGSWSFNHHDGPCHGYCRHPGDFASVTAATGLALLPFYGAGHTHREGDFKDVVKKGIVYLGTKMLVTSNGGDLQNGSMYGQGLAAIALCEAYAMTEDESLRKYAQAAVDFIVYAQHTEGGWRYMPGQPGDTTVTGWQLMALKSGKSAGLSVSSEAIYRVRHFLDRVQSEDGAKYGYQDNEPRSTTTAIGLYCRMLMGWNRYHPSLNKGVEYLQQQGPSPNDMYFNYHATQVLHHFDGPSWPKWNQLMRDRLIAEQANRGHESGSWYYEDKHSVAGGRHYSTCMALMTLEVYYRYMPLYGHAATDP